MQTIILRLPAVKEASGLARSTLYDRIAAGLWTPGVSLGPRCVGWPSNEVEALNAARVAGKSDTEIRELVQRLVQARQNIANLL